MLYFCDIINLWRKLLYLFDSRLIRDLLFYNNFHKLILQVYHLLKDNYNKNEIEEYNMLEFNLKGNNIITEHSQEGDSYDNEDNIYNLLNEAESYILKNIRWRTEINRSEREEIPEIPVAAIREVLANSFAHAIYGGRTTHEM